MEFTMNYEPPDDVTRIRCIEAHTGGEPLRVIYGGFPELEGDTILAKRRYAREHFDHLRTALMHEPRGHADMYGCILTAAAEEGSHFGVLFTHNEGFSSMCGHGIIAVTTVALECGLLPIDISEVRIDAPAGLIRAYPRIEGGRVVSVSFDNVPSFVADTRSVQVEGLGSVDYTIAYGGAFYAYVDADLLGIELEPGNATEVIELGRRIKHAVMESNDMNYHPHQPDLNFLYGTIFVSRRRADVHSRNACVFADGELDRSPTGTGVSGRAAIHHAAGEIVRGESIRIESIIGSAFDVHVEEECTFGGRKAVIPRVTGSASICGRTEWLIDPRDDLKHGLILRSPSFP